MDVIVVAYPTSYGWEWEVFPDCEHGLSDSQNCADSHKRSRIFTIDVFNVIADEIDEQAPWMEPA